MTYVTIADIIVLFHRLAPLVFFYFLLGLCPRWPVTYVTIAVICLVCLTVLHRGSTAIAYWGVRLVT